MAYFCNILLWTIPHFSCRLSLSFSLIGLSLFTWHCASRHRTSSQRSHLPNRHIHSLQKCQADKVSNPMPFFKDAYLGNVFWFLAWKHVKCMSSMLCVLVPLPFTQFPLKFRSFYAILRKSFIQAFWFWRLFVRVYCLENEILQKCSNIKI